MEINPIYVKEETITKLKQLFQTDKDIPHLQLHQFFTPNSFQLLQKQFLNQKYSSHKKPLLFSYSIGKSPHLIDLSVLSSIIKQKISQIPFKSYQFQHKEYILRNDKTKKSVGIDLIIDLTPHWSDSYGGVLSYTQGKHTIILPSHPNSLTLIKKNQHTQKYLTYINHYAKKHKRTLLVASIHRK